MSLLELKDVSKHFGAIHALSAVSLSLEPGEVLGLMGDNGAGKSTLVKISAGNFPPSHGDLQIDGRSVRFHKQMYRRAGNLSKELKSETRPRDLVRQMSGGQRQAVATARTRLAQVRLVLMDEPTAAISVRQVAEVLDLIRRLSDQGIYVCVPNYLPG